MTKINMEELLADREAGTPGPWSGRQLLEGGVSPEPCDYGVISLEKGIEVCRNWWIEDTRRIERLPDLEAAYIEAVEFLRKIADNPMHDNLSKIELEVAARKFLEQSQ